MKFYKWVVLHILMYVHKLRYWECRRKVEREIGLIKIEVAYICGIWRIEYAFWHRRVKKVETATGQVLNCSQEDTQCRATTQEMQWSSTETESAAELYFWRERLSVRFDRYTLIVIFQVKQRSSKLYRRNKLLYDSFIALVRWLFHSFVILGSRSWCIQPNPIGSYHFHSVFACDGEVIFLATHVQMSLFVDRQD